MPWIGVLGRDERPEGEGIGQALLLQVDGPLGRDASEDVVGVAPTLDVAYALVYLLQRPAFSNISSLAKNNIQPLPPVATTTLDDEGLAVVFQDEVLVSCAAAAAGGLVDDLVPYQLSAIGVAGGLRSLRIFHKDDVAGRVHGEVVLASVIDDEDPVGFMPNICCAFRHRNKLDLRFSQQKKKGPPR